VSTAALSYLSEDILSTTTATCPPGLVKRRPMAQVSSKKKRVLRVIKKNTNKYRFLRLKNLNLRGMPKKFMLLNEWHLPFYSHLKSKFKVR
jgi:hypothetical protein